MIFKKTFLDGLYIIEPKVFHDHRGYFFESFRADLAIKNNINSEFLQDNESSSKYGTLRGLHFQRGEWAQAKIVRVSKGKILDIVVDIRKNSSTFANHIAVELSDTNYKQLYIPRGFAHGFLVLSDFAIIQYKCDNYYNKDAEGGINFADPKLAINWPLPLSEIIISERDANFPNLDQCIL